MQAAAVEPILSRLEGIVEADRVIVSTATESLTFSGLSACCHALAEKLSRQGIRNLALHLDNGLDWIVTDIACQLASVCLVPLPTFFSVEQLRHVLETIPLDAILTCQPDRVAPLCSGSNRPWPESPIAGCTMLYPESPQNPAALPEGCGKITFTSGSTGQPKGVCLGNRQLFEQAAALAQAVALERPRHLCLLPLSTLLENIAGVYSPWLSGGEIVVPSLSEIGFEGSSTLDPGAFLETIGRYRPNSIILTPQLLRLMVTAARNGWVPPSSLRFVAVGGARAPRGLLEDAQALGIPAYEGYGLSECASVVSLNLPGHSRRGCCGKPLAHLSVDIEDGEIVVSGNPMLGYAGEPASWNANRIRTGDLGRLDADGYLFIDGRRKNLLISSFGRNISPEWVESELLAQSRLAECVVYGDARPWCVALVSPRDPAERDETIQHWIGRCNDGLPDYARIRRWHRLPQPLATAEGLLTDNGRPRREAILERYQSAIESLYEPEYNPREEVRIA